MIDNPRRRYADEFEDKGQMSPGEIARTLLRLELAFNENRLEMDTNHRSHSEQLQKLVAVGLLNENRITTLEKKQDASEKRVRSGVWFVVSTFIASAIGWFFAWFQARPHP